MNEQFKNIVVHITSEEMLQQAREIIEMNGVKTNLDTFGLCWCEGLNYVQYTQNIYMWEMEDKASSENEITLSEFEKLF